MVNSTPMAYHLRLTECLYELEFPTGPTAPLLLDKLHVLRHQLIDAALSDVSHLPTAQSLSDVQCKRSQFQILLVDAPHNRDDRKPWRPSSDWENQSFCTPLFPKTPADKNVLRHTSQDNSACATSLPPPHSDYAPPSPPPARS